MLMTCIIPTVSDQLYGKFKVHRTDRNVLEFILSLTTKYIFDYKLSLIEGPKIQYIF